mmetsp:Transcript_31881/g.36824  ORF Transcript_31881/g.36824 Transcript_31881/m.36824 type:complete len:708 (+) Transcript_31881:57-2180(+)|eukprot:CAMPEP_0176405640 /NCGR_PEP_ID=MMETSP0127-20121128/444_1 /TAXON_ID=938130 /ORGANISM="Platyophrya macrostoma, Strain WH" /LENGTH=707 /DNA_ID=CAMNT_0017784709 /DNA_START=48 /DNA_END=2171 /DNA_ORIENTATION=+
MRCVPKIATWGSKSVFHFVAPSRVCGYAFHTSLVSLRQVGAGGATGAVSMLIPEESGALKAHESDTSHQVKKINISPALCRHHHFEADGLQNDFEFFDTATRRHVRKEIEQCVRKIAPEDSISVLVEGPSRVGKSSNIAVAVQELRNAGHAVVYVSNCDILIGPRGVQKFFAETEFAMREWMTSQNISEESPFGLLTRELHTLWSETQSSVHAYDVEQHSVGGQFTNLLTKLEDAIVNQNASSRLVFIFDQEQHLLEAVEENPQFASLLQWLRELPCHVTFVVGSTSRPLHASAHIQKHRRHFSKVISHSILDAVPLHFLRSHSLVSREELMLIKSRTAFHPGTTMAAVNLASKAKTPEQRLVAMEDYFAHLRNDIQEAFFEFAHPDASSPGGNKTDAAVTSEAWKGIFSLRTNRQPMWPIDSRFVTRSGAHNSDTLEPLHPVAKHSMRAVALNHLLSHPALLQDVPLAEDYALNFTLAAPFLLGDRRSGGAVEPLVYAEYDFDVPRADRIQSFRDGWKPKVLLTMSPRSPVAALYLLERNRDHSDQVDATLFRCVHGSASTVATHRIFAMTRFPHLSGATMLDRLRANGVNGDVRYVYVTVHHKLQLTVLDAVTGAKAGTESICSTDASMVQIEPFNQAFSEGSSALNKLAEVPGAAVYRERKRLKDMRTFLATMPHASPLRLAADLMCVRQNAAATKSEPQTNNS